MTTYAFLADVSTSRLHTIDAPDADTAAQEASKIAAAAVANMEGTGTFTVWLIPLDQVTVYRSQVTVQPGYDVALTRITVDQATGQQP
jgi:formate-dependent phosphoribosylglycinamide formyltransferase (GAR transformylase)